MGFVVLFLFLVLVSGSFLLLTGGRAASRQVSKKHTRQPEAGAPVPPGLSGQQREAACQLAPPVQQVTPAPPSLRIVPSGTLPLRIAPSQTPPLRIQPSNTSPVRIAPSGKPPLTVVLPSRAIWDDRGWKRQEEDGIPVYIGEYRVKDKRSGQECRFRGRIRETPTEAEAYVCNPPAAALVFHPKKHCFRAVPSEVAGHVGPSNWYRLHWWRAPADADAAISSVEQVLFESINHYPVAGDV